MKATADFKENNDATHSEEAKAVNKTYQVLVLEQGSIGGKGL